MVNIQKGLEGVYVGESKLGSVDGKNGILRYVGYDIHDLAENATFEEVLYLLWFRKLPNKKELSSFTRELKKSRKLSKQVIDWIKKVPKKAHPTDVIRTVVSWLGMFDKKLNHREPKEVVKKGIKLAAVLPTIIATFHRVKHRKRIVAPNNNLGHAANFLYMLHGKLPTQTEEKVMDVCFILHAEHGLNASAFSARVTVSTLAEVYSAITSAIGTLEGPLHGGANEKVLDMLKEIKVEKNVEKYITKKIKNHKRIMGFGHRVYKVKDPRAYILERYSRKLGEELGKPKWYEMSKSIEKIVTKKLSKKKIYPNVDFYSASTYYYLNIPEEIYPGIFACSRIGGWIGHVIEQFNNNRLIRPRVLYTGPESKKFVEIQKRR